MNEPNSPETPETFADAIAKLRTFGAFPDQARIDAVVAAHEREVGKLLMDNVRLTASLVCEDNPHIAKDLATANRMIERKDATIAELKHLNIEHCEALRKIAGSAQSCAGNINEQCDNNCRSCVNYAANIARAALEKTGGAE